MSHISMKTRADIERYGWVPGWHGEPVEVGEYAVAYGTGQWRVGKVVKVTPSYVWVEYVAPSSRRTWVAKADRRGRRTDLYVRPR